MTFDYHHYEHKIMLWADARGILRNGNARTQLLKTVSELGELADAVIKNDRAAIVDGLGDVLVTLIVVSNMLDLDLTNCLGAAYDQIKDRRGYLNANGVFVKEDPSS